MDEDIKISKDLLKTISADTRAEILKLLEQRQMTASELSRALGKHVTTISEHVELLLNSNLVERVERPGRKWIYYKLTKNANNIIHPTSYSRWAIVLSMTFVIFAGSLIASSNATPDSPLYGLKRFTESARLAVASDEQARASVHLDIAGERLKEAKIMSQGKNVEMMKIAIDDYKKEIDNLDKEIDNEKIMKHNSTELLEKVSEDVARHTSILENIGDRHPEYKGEIGEALNLSMGMHEKARNNLKEKN